MNNKSPFKGYVTLSNHGTSTGIIPRFFNQISDIAQYAIGKERTDELFGQFLDNNIIDFTDLHDIHQEIMLKYNNYNEGLRNGTYYSKNSLGQFSHDKSMELELERKIKNFFILGKVLINNFIKSGIIDSKDFPLIDFIFVSDHKFTIQKETYLKDPSHLKFEILINVVEYARSEFLSTFIKIRNDIEHNQFKVPTFIINTETDEIIEPTIMNDYTLQQEVSFFYDFILDMIEVLLVYYYSILGIEKHKILGLYERDEYDFSNLRSRFVLLPRMKMAGHTLLL